LIGLHIALAPCLLGYGALADQLHKDPKSKREANPYWDWIENYVAEDYVTAVKAGKGEFCADDCKALHGKA
jgi:thiaminase